VKRFEKIAFFERCNIDCINYIFVNDRSILLYNTKYLHHTYPTDIITFDYSEFNYKSGDIYISIDTVRYHSQKFNVSFKNELNRVIIHGLLHLIGYKDKTVAEKKLMRFKENYYLRLFTEL
jgi:probable rRNA maturation factor